MCPGQGYPPINLLPGYFPFFSNGFDGIGGRRPASPDLILSVGSAPDAPAQPTARIPERAARLDVARSTTSAIAARARLMSWGVSRPSTTVLLRLARK